MVKFINKTVRFFFIPLLFLIMFSLTRTLVATFMNYAWYSYIVAAVAIIAILFVMILSANKLEKIYSSISRIVGNISTKKLFFLLGGICLVIKIGGVLIFNCNCNLHPDMSKYISFADQIAHTGQVTENVDYAMSVPYTLVYGVVLSPVGLISGSNPMGYAIFMCLINTATMLMLFDIIRKYAGNTTTFIGLLIYNILPMGFFQTQVVIHETALFFFHITAFWLLQKVFDSKATIALKVLFLIISALCITVGGAINQSGIIIILSLAIFSAARIFEINKKSVVNKGKRIARTTLSLALVIITMAGCMMGTSSLTNACSNTFVAKSSSVSTQKSIPYGWPLYLGANYEESGAWNKEDRDTYYLYKEIENEEEAKEYQRNLIKERYEEFLHNPYRIPIHFYKKIAILWSPYFAFRNVPDNPTYQTMATAGGGILRLLCIAVTMLCFAVCYLMTLIGLIKNKKQNHDTVTPQLHFMMVVIGLTLVLLLFEVMAKYSSHAQILIFAVGMMNFRSFRENIGALRSKLFRKQRRLAN